MATVKEGSRWEKQYEKTTLVRVSSDTHTRIKNLIRPGESIQDVISRAISLLETGNTPLPDTDVCVNGAVNVDVNDIVNRVFERVNAGINNTLTQIDKRLEALEAQPVHSVDDKPEENTRGDEHDQDDKIRIEGDVRTQIRMKIVDSGTTTKQISDLTGINESAIKKLKSENNHDTVNLKPHQIEALMNLSSEKSSSEAL